jgi:hypothetical protein
LHTNLEVEVRVQENNGGLLKLAIIQSRIESSDIKNVDFTFKLNFISGNELIMCAL